MNTWKFLHLTVAADVNWNMIRVSMMGFPLKAVLLESSPKDQNPSSTHILPGILV